MTIAEKNIIVQGIKIVLTNQRVLLLPQYHTLVLSDMHLGKPAHFRKHGIPVSGQVAQEDLHQLERLIRYYQPQKVVIVGDFLHAGVNTEVLAFTRLSVDFPTIEFILVRGNHDRVKDDVLRNMGISTIHTTHQIGGLYFLHEYKVDLPSFQINGHIHPGILMTSKTKKTFSLPAFVWTDKQLILPAFGRFTGLDTKTLFPNARFFAFYENDIFEY